MDFKYTDYEITLDGRDLTCDSSIKIMKYENKVSRLVFKIDDEELLSNARLYCAVYIKELGKYHYEPLIDNTLIIGTSISYYPGKKTLILIGITPSYELDDNITLDVTNTVFVSKEFNRMTVIENFIDDDAMALSMPSLDAALDNFMVLHDNVIELSMEVADDTSTCKESVESCNTILSQCNEVLSECESILEQIQETQRNLSSAYNSYRNQLRADYEEYRNILREEAERIVQS